MFKCCICGESLNKETAMEMLSICWDSCSRVFVCKSEDSRCSGELSRINYENMRPLKTIKFNADPYLDEEEIQKLWEDRDIYRKAIDK